MADEDIRRTEALGVAGGPIPEAPDREVQRDGDAAEDSRRTDMTPGEFSEAVARDEIVKRADQASTYSSPLGPVGEVEIPEGDRNLGARPIEGRKDLDEQEI